MSRAVWAWWRPLLAGHSARNFSSICRRGGGHRAHVTSFPDRRVIAALQSVCTQLQGLDCREPSCPPPPLRMHGSLGPFPLQGSGGRVASHGVSDAEKLSRSPAETQWTPRPALPGGLGWGRGGVSGHPQLCPEGYSPFPAGAVGWVPVFRFMPAGGRFPPQRTAPWSQGLGRWG